MAFTIADAVVRLIGDDSALGKTFSGVKEKTTSLVSGLTSSLATIGGAAALAGVTAVVGGITAIGVAAFNVASDVDSAVNNISTKLGIAKEEAEGYADVIKGVYANNFGESMDDVAAAIVAVEQSIGNVTDLTDAELQSLTETAFGLQDAFDIGIGESTLAAKTLMEQFGLSGQEAMDFITYGIQNGLDANGDFLDTIGEYSNQFKAAGFDAGQFYSILESGQAGGALGTDKIADAVKEMNIILGEGGVDAAKAFEKATGMSFERVQGFIAGGDEMWADYFPDIIEGLNSIEDPLERQQAQIAIFGTMAEDLGPAFTQGLSTVSTSLEDMAGSTDTLNQQYNNLGSFMEGFKRRAVVALEPVGAVLLDLVNQAMPTIEAGFAWFETTAVPMIQTFAAWLSINLPVAIATLTEAFNTYWPMIQTAVMNAWNFINGSIVQPLVSFFQSEGPGALDFLSAKFNEIWPLITAAAQSFWGFFEPNILTPLQQWFAATMPVALEQLRAFWVDVLWPNIQTAAATAWSGLKIFLEGLQVLFDTVLPAAFAIGGAAWRALWNDIETITTAAQAVIQPVFDAIQRFAEWLSTATFSFNFEWPELPDWATMNSPMKLHTGLAELADFAANNPIEVGFVGDAFNALATGAAAVGAAAESGAAGFGELRVENINVSGVPPEQAREAGRQIGEGLRESMRARGLLTR